MPFCTPRLGAFSCIAPAPASTPASSSHATARPDPLCSPNGSSAPPPSAGERPKNVPGSVESRPAASMIQPSGTFFPSLSATRTLPAATRLVAKSSTKGGLPSWPGKVMQIGSVPSRPAMPPQGATRPGTISTLTKKIATSPASAACSP